MSVTVRFIEDIGSDPAPFSGLSQTLSDFGKKCHGAIQELKKSPLGGELRAERFPSLSPKAKVQKENSDSKENSTFSMKSHTFTHQIRCKINRKCSQKMNKLRNNDFCMK